MPKKKKKNKRVRKIEKELLYIIGFMVFLVVVFLVASSIFKSFNSFEYEGLTFTKERAGEIPIYHYYYYFTNPKNELIQYNLYLRNDPRENNVPVEGDDISFGENEVVFISVNASELQKCKQGVLAIGSLSSFLTDNQIFVKSGNLDFWDAGNKRQDWITCENRPKNLVIEISEGEETKINIDENCHEITVNNCEILQATEKYEIQSIIDARKSDPEGRIVVS